MLSHGNLWRRNLSSFIQPSSFPTWLRTKFTVPRNTNLNSSGGSLCPSWHPHSLCPFDSKILALARAFTENMTQFWTLATSMLFPFLFLFTALYYCYLTTFLFLPYFPESRTSQKITVLLLDGCSISQGQDRLLGVAFPIFSFQGWWFSS